MDVSMEQVVVMMKGEKFQIIMTLPIIHKQVSLHVSITTNNKNIALKEAMKKISYVLAHLMTNKIIMEINILITFKDKDKDFSKTRWLVKTRIHQW